MKNSPFSLPSRGEPSEGRDSFDLNAWRTNFILTVLRFACVLGIVLIVITFPTSTGRDRVLYVGIYIVLLAITIAPVSYPARALTLLILTFAIGVNAILAWGPWLDGSLFLLSGIVLSSLLLDRRADWLALLLSLLVVGTIATAQLTGGYQLTADGAPRPGVEVWVGYMVNLAIAGTILIAAIGQLKNTFSRMVAHVQDRETSITLDKKQMEEQLHKSAEKLAAHRVQIQAAAHTTRAIAESKTISELLETAVNLIAEKFGHYHVGLYVLDEQQQTAFLQAASSETGKGLIGQAFRIETDKRNPIHLTVQFNRHTISSDLDRANFIRDPNFPLTRSRMTLPLAIRGQVIGFFDIHSDQTGAFTTQDAEILQMTADLTAIAFDNARLTDETQSLISQLGVNTAAQTRRAWSKLSSRKRPAYQYTPAGVRPVFSHDKNSGDEGLRVPLTLHGQTIGKIKLKRKGIRQDWTERERLLIEKIADQIALALENSRLVDEAQKSAARDQMIATVSARIRETLDIESVIRTAADEMRRVFDLKEAEITVGAPGPSSPPGFIKSSS
jgi:GAF domain-containing protein